MEWFSTHTAFVLLMLWACICCCVLVEVEGFGLDGVVVKCASRGSISCCCCCCSSRFKVSGAARNVVQIQTMNWKRKSNLLLSAMIDEDDFGEDGGAEDAFGEDLDTAGVVLNDLSWRVEKLRLEEQNTKRFLKARPVFLPYAECSKWVQAFNRWKTEDDWREWIAMGEKRNAYIPVSVSFCRMVIIVDA